MLLDFLEKVGGKDRAPDTIYIYVLKDAEWVQAEFLLPSGNTSDSLLGYARRKFVTKEDVMDPLFSDEALGYLEICLPGDDTSAALYNVDYSSGQLRVSETEVYQDGVPEFWHF